MRDDGIFDGDLVGIHRTNEAKSDQIVVARIDDEITIKRLKIGKNGIRLLPLQARSAKPYPLSGNRPTSIILEYGKLVSNLSQLMRQVPNTLLYTKY